MSALLIETPPAETASAGMGTDASQLFFDFEPAASRPAIAKESVEANVDFTAETSANISELQEEPVISSAGRRRSLGQPVRIGTVMLKLLKSYGISDDEIQAGLADYASRKSAEGQVLANAS